MFTQSLGTNTNKCNGCTKLCTVSAFYYTRNGTGYLPVIDNKIKTYYIDAQGNKRKLHLYKTITDAINCAKTISQSCPHFKDKRIPYRPTTQLDFNICIGCNKRCMISSEKIQGVFYPKIGDKLIRKYINSRGEMQKTPAFYDDFHAKMYAMHTITKRCDNYQKQKTK